MQDAKKEGVRDMYGRVKRTFQTYKELLLLGLLGIPIGLVVGGIDAVFGRVLLAITDFRNGHRMQLIPFRRRGCADWRYLFPLGRKKNTAEKQFPYFSRNRYGGRICRAF